VKRKRFSVEQIVGVLKQAEVGVPVAELIRQVGITEQTLQELALSLPSMLPSAHVNRVGVRVVSFRGSIAHPAYPLSTLRWVPRGISARLGAERIASPFS